MVQTKRADFNGLAKELGVSPVSVRIMRNRGMETKEAMERYLYGTLDGLYDGGRMKNMGEAVAERGKACPDHRGLRYRRRLRLLPSFNRPKTGREGIGKKNRAGRKHPYRL